MKKLAAAILATVMCMALSACGRSKMLAFPFEASDVVDVESYHYIVPAETEKKCITEQQAIAEVIDGLSGITLKDKEIEERTGCATTSFRFHLTDGTSYNVIYYADAVKSGTIRFTDDETTWFTSADIGGLWQNLDADVIHVDEKDLPMLE